MVKLLVLSSNPRRDLNLDREILDLTTALQRLGTFEIGLGLGVRPQELTERIADGYDLWAELWADFWADIRWSSLYSTLHSTLDASPEESHSLELCKIP